MTIRVARVDPAPHDFTMETKHDWSAADALTEEQVHAAALADPDAQPLTEERLTTMRRVPRARSISRALTPDEA
jgi:hypothetical protein